MILLLLACAPEAPPEDGLQLLSAREQLIRASVDLRGIHPSEEELSAIDAHPELYEGFVDRYLDDPRFEGRLREVWDLRWLTRTGQSYFDAGDAGISVDPVVLSEAVGEEPLQLLSYAYNQDLPYSYVVTADHTMANPLLASFYGLSRNGEGEGWLPANYQDGRPMAGVLSMATTWLRYPSMGGNANRHRANAVSKMFLCDDYLSRPIVLNRAQVDQLTVDPEDAIATNAACQSCHSTLDPLAAHFYGFYHVDAPENLQDALLYLPENEEGWRGYANKSPGYYGTPTSSLEELGQRITEDPRFYDCAVKTAFQGFTQRNPSDADWTEIAGYRSTFEESGWRLRPLVRALVTARSYRAKDAHDAALAARLATVRTVSPEQLSSIIADITGYTWNFGGNDGLKDRSNGLPVLLGGVDGLNVTIPGRDPSVGAAFAQERLAQAAAWAVVQHDLDPARTEDARLLRYVSIDDTPEADAAAFDTQIRYLYLRITGIPLEDNATEPAELTALWKQIYAVEGSKERSWAGIVSAVLRDPRVLFY